MTAPSKPWIWGRCLRLLLACALFKQFLHLSLHNHIHSLHLPLFVLRSFGNRLQAFSACAVMRRRGCTKLHQVLCRVVLWSAAALFMLSLVVNLCFYAFDIYINTTPSLPYGLYQASYRPQVEVSFFGYEIKEDSARAVDVLSVSPITRGSVVLVCLQDEIAAIASERNYLGAGKCPYGMAPIGKEVVAVAGDHVAIEPQGVKVNGVLISNSQQALTDGEGGEMPQVRVQRVLQEGELLLINDKPDSFDGRYFGPSKSDQVIATLRSIFVLD